MISYIVYKKLSGEIVRSCYGPQTLITYDMLSDEDYIEHASVDDTKFYIVNDSVTPRPTFSESISGTVISNLPIPTTVRTNGSSYTIDDGSAELSFSLPGTYRVYLSSFPYQYKVVEVTQT